MENIKTFTK